MNRVEFGKQLKKARKAKRMTQPELAERIGKTESSIRKYENGTIEPPWNIIEKMAAILDVSPFDLTADAEQLRSDVKLIESISKVYGSEAPVLLNDFDKLNQTGKKKAREYVSDLADQEKYCTKEKEPSSAATDPGSEG